LGVDVVCSDWEEISRPKSGGQGSVCKIQNRITGEVGAYKKMHDSKKAQLRNRFFTEVEMLSKAAVDGLPRLLESNHSEYQNKNIELYAISEWIDGKTLQEHINGKPMGLDVAIDLLKKLASIVGECHEMNILHRDIKPDNIMFSDGKIFLVDFGMAKDLDSESDLTSLQVELGNRFIRLPEYTAGTHSFTTASDLTQVVGVFFYALTGQYPRVLLDSHSKMPHERIDLRGFVANEDDFIRCKRIFDTGFNQNILLRFQTTQHLLSYLKDGNERISEMAEDQISKLKDFFNSSKFNELDTRNNILQRISESFKEAVNEVGNEVGCILGGSEGANEDATEYQLEFYMVRSGTSSPTVSFIHIIKIENQAIHVYLGIESNQANLYYSCIRSDIEGAITKVRDKGREAGLEIVGRLKEYYERNI
jgi:serine/threonine protein kinase